MLTPEEKDNFKKRLQDLDQEHQKLAGPAKETRPNWMRYTHLGLEFLGIFLIFLFGGIKADEALGTKPWLLLLGLFAGFGLALFRLIKVANELAKSE